VAALIGLMPAGQKPARSANNRTGRSPLSNPPTLQILDSTGNRVAIRLDSHQAKAVKTRTALVSLLVSLRILILVI